ncbi:glycosyltransferase 87 family protein [Streptomyces beihaiensis]|uniref:Glycosyltransferase 87 family protein n=1 Tax=Streptomyces beihaiensis TaxID=2984495 RepID=A0ABT3TZ87_9ACTN|nr:glycosyltransferase 87 family protein [Streptomyces beihaiensis]MCX3062378.1 glycosyltransferase 87 family protein [Streptomyces beihaiensis]
MKTRHPAALLVTWALTRTLLLLCVFKVIVVPGPDVTSDVSVIYHGWFEVLRTGTFPLHDVTWQYPPAAATAILSPALLPFLDYASAFFLLAFLADAAVFVMLLYVAERHGKARRGVWVWVVGVPLLGQTVYARYDVMVTAVAVAALLAAARHPRAAGLLAAVGAMLKVWPVLVLTGMRRGVATRASWGAALFTGGLLLLAFTFSMPGAMAFLTFQRDRGTEVESLGSLVFHVARQFGWQGSVRLNYGSVEFLGPYVHLVSTVAQVLTVVAFAWLVLWRVRARAWEPSTTADAALTAVLLFTTTSRVISPQYMVWLVGLAAVCLLYRGSRMTLPTYLVLAATFVTFLEFPIWFGDVVTSDVRGVTLLLIRNGLLVAASLTACRRLWRTTVTAPRRAADSPRTPQPAQEQAVRAPS